MTQPKHGWMESQRKEKKFTPRKRLKQQAHDYADATTIHGIKYIGETNRTVAERVLWLLLWIGSIMLCAALIEPIYTKWQNSPTITTVATTNYPVWKINFPAVTICSNNKLMTTQFEKIMKEEPWLDAVNASAEARCLFKQDNYTVYTYQAEVCNSTNATSGTITQYPLDETYTNSRPSLGQTLREVVKKFIYFTEDAKSASSFSDGEVYIFDNYRVYLEDMMQDVMHPCEDMIMVCSWQGEIHPCAPDLFEVRRTDNGFCCSFNALDLEEQFVGGHDEEEEHHDEEEEDHENEGDDHEESGEEGEHHDEEEEDHHDGASTSKRKKRGADDGHDESAHQLKKTNSANALLGLSILIYSDPKEYNVSLNNYYGFKVLVHSPYSFPEVTGKGFAIGQSKEVFIAVGAQYTESSESVLEMDLHKRECIKHGENVAQHGIKLEAFGEYSRPSCLLECRAHLLHDICDCLPYYYPDFTEVWGHKATCDKSGLQCLANLTAQLNAMATDEEDHDSYSEFIKGADCYCPIDCKEVVYTQEVSQAELRYDSLAFDRLNGEPIFEAIYEKIDHLREIVDKLKSEYEAKIGNFTLMKNCTEDANLGSTTECSSLNVTDAVLLDAESDANNTRLAYSDKERELNATEENLADIRSKMSLVHIYYKELGVVKYNRDELYNVMDVVAAFGGIVGLCMGFSILSGVELIYYFTLRLFIDYQRDKRAQVKTNPKPKRLIRNNHSFME